MLYIKPVLLGQAGLSEMELKADKQACLHFGPCGVGKKALYLNSFFVDRYYYIPVSNIQRVYKLVAMSKGGFTGKGIFGAIPYLVVEYGNGKKIRCTFKFEYHVDEMLAEIQRRFSCIKTISAEAAKRMAEAYAAEEARYKKNLDARAQETLTELYQAKEYLEQRADLVTRLAAESKAKRVNQMTNPAYRWAALAIFCFAVITAGYGVYNWFWDEGDNGIYITLGGLAVIFFFSSLNVLPTARNNSRVLSARLQKTREELEVYLHQYPSEHGFPVPARYAHPATLSRMIRSVREGRSHTVEESFEDMKSVLKSLHSGITVSQIEYDEVVAIKPMFLLEDYR